MTFTFRLYQNHSRRPNNENSPFAGLDKSAGVGGAAAPAHAERRRRRRAHETSDDEKGRCYRPIKRVAPYGSPLSPPTSLALTAATATASRYLANDVGGRGPWAVAMGRGSPRWGFSK